MKPNPSWLPLPAVVLAVACGSSPSRDGSARSDEVKIAPPAPVSPATQPSGASPGSGADACSKLRGHQVRAQSAAIREAQRGGPGPDEASDPLLEKDVADRLTKETATCHATKRGAWGLVVERISGAPWDGWAGVRVLLSLSYADPSGIRSRVTPFDAKADGGLAAKDDNFYFSTVDGAEVKSLSTFDYDGDGEAEVTLVLSGRYHEGESWAWGRVYTMRDGTIQPYGPAATIPFSSVVDEDGDGRPDLLGGEPYDEVFENCCSGFSSELTGPPLLAHSLPNGSFSRTDALALAVAKRSCPAPPKEIVPGGASAWEVGAVHTAVACARIWGAPGEKILASMDGVFGKAKRSDGKAKKSDAKVAPKSDCDMTRCVSPAAIRKSAEAWVAVTPPLTLR